MSKFSKLLSLLIAFVLTSCGDSLKEKVVSRYDNGQPAKVKYLDKEDVCVREVEYYEDGKLYMEGPIKDDLREGEWFAYFPDGKVQSSGIFVQGKNHGKHQIFYENGQLWMDGYYKEDQKCGEWIIYDEQGYEIARLNYGDCD